MARPDLASIDRELDGFGLDPKRLEGVRQRARTAATELGGAEAFFASLGEALPPRQPRPAWRAPNVPKLEAPPPEPAKAKSEPAPPPKSQPAPPRAETLVPEGAVAHPTSFDAETAQSAEREPGSGLVEVSDAVLATADVPAVLSVAPPGEEGRASIEVTVEEPPAPPAIDPLELESDASLDLAGAAPLDSMFASIPKEVIAAAKPPTQPPPARKPTDLEAELAALFAEESEPPPPAPPEAPEAPITFDADAHLGTRSDDDDFLTSERTSISRPDMVLPGAPDASAGEDFELDIDEDVEVLDDSEIIESPSSEVAVPASLKSRPPEPPPKSRPPPPKSRPPETPKSKPPEAPGKGFLNRLLNRKG